MTATVKILGQQKITEINSRAQEPAYSPWLVFGVVLLTLATFWYISFYASLGVFAVGYLATRPVRKRDVARRTSSLYYVDTNQRFAAVQKTCERLAGSHGIWLVTAEQDTPDWKRQAGATTVVSKERARFGIVEAPFISTNVTIWGIDTDKLKVLFFPDAVLVYQDGRYEGFAYRALRVNFSLTRFIEHGPPQDAEIVGHTWQYVNKNGGPDRRYNNNTQIPVALYGLLSISLVPKIDLQLQVSNRYLAAQFVQDLGRILGQGEKRRENASNKHQSTGRRRSTGEKRPPKPPESAKVKSAREILEIGPNATKTEIVAAYRKKAQMYHPDKVAGLAPEFQELAEVRMKEINRAYAELIAQTKG